MDDPNSATPRPNRRSATQKGLSAQREPHPTFRVGPLLFTAWKFGNWRSVSHILAMAEESATSTTAEMAEFIAGVSRGRSAHR